jgi:hypothetical protein
MSMSKFATSADFQAWKEARNEALRTLDLDYARNQMGRPASDEMLLLSLHKARYECTGIEPEYRHESARWLRERGYGRLTGTPLLDDGELPE